MNQIFKFTSKRGNYVAPRSVVHSIETEAFILTASDSEITGSIEDIIDGGTINLDGGN